MYKFSNFALVCSTALNSQWWYYSTVYLFWQRMSQAKQLYSVVSIKFTETAMIVKTLWQEGSRSALCIIFSEVMNDVWTWLMVFVENMIFRSSPVRSGSFFFFVFNVILYRNFLIYYGWSPLDDKLRNSASFHIIKYIKYIPEILILCSRETSRNISETYTLRIWKPLGLRSV